MISNYLTINIIKFNIYIIVSFFISFVLGYLLVNKLRDLYQKNNNTLQTLILIPLTTPVLLFILLNILSRYDLVNLVIGDSFAFGFLIGIIYVLSIKPNNENTIKLIVNQLHGPSVEVWLSNKNNIKVGEVRQIIALQGFNIKTSNRVNIESGKGHIIEDMTLPFFNIIDNIKTDFFGYHICSCYVTIKDAEPDTITEINNTDNLELKKNIKKNFLSINILNTKGEAKFGVELLVIAKVPTASTSAAPFHISSVELFACASPTHNNRTIRFVKWDINVDKEFNKNDNSDGFDNDNDLNNNMSPASVILSTQKSKLNINDNANNNNNNNNNIQNNYSCIDLRASGQPIRHGDVVVLESDSKYMSVARGWWLKWGSTIPRRSGAFIIEIVEKAPQNIISNHIRDIGKDIGETIKETFDRIDVLKIGDQLKSQMASVAVNNDNNLVIDTSAAVIGDPIRTGDAFRLRSIKFPEYEIGITNVKLRDDLCYLGLRKIGDTASAGSDNWCQEVRFYIKLNSMATELFKMPEMRL